jgi:hypothetical protein
VVNILVKGIERIALKLLMRDLLKDLLMVLPVLQVIDLHVVEVLGGVLLHLEQVYTSPYDFKQSRDQRE